MQLNDAMKKIRNYDPVTYKHCLRVGHAARLLAESLGKPEEFCKTIEKAGMLHDIGKVKIPLSIIDKSGPLTAEERAVVNAHVSFGLSELKKLDDYRPEYAEYAEAVADHHAYHSNPEKGYQASRQWHEPSEVAQIMAIADVYDALANKRSYKKEFSNEKIKEIMDENLKDGQFNPAIYETFQREVVPQLIAEKERSRAPQVNETRGNTRDRSLGEPVAERFKDAIEESQKQMAQRCAPIRSGAELSR